MNRKLTALAVFLMTALACVLPATQPASISTPTPDTRLEIMVAETVSAALQLTQQAIPTATETSQPPTLVAASATPSAESVWDKNPDGSSAFTDLLGKYRVTFPMQWLTSRINAPEFEIISAMPETANPAIQRSLNVIKNQNPDVFRLFALDVNEEHIDNGFVTNISVLWDRQLETSSLDQAGIKALADTLVQSLNDSEILTTELKATKSGIPYGLITTRSSVQTQEGANVSVFQTLIFFDTPVGTLNITLSTTEKWLETVQPSFDAVIESFELIE